MNETTTSETRYITNEMGEEMTYSVGSGNIFADLGVDEPEERLKKAQATAAYKYEPQPAVIVTEPTQSGGCSGAPFLCHGASRE